ncbi:hypothetical protein ACFQH3_20455 [Haladaptatus sp. GCM10025707]|uniref:hypothetical protein n=1 Tax=Haladaptatus sp. GCM10025707 TaxID=3252658 RepID=UPI003623C6A8
MRIVLDDVGFRSPTNRRGRVLALLADGDLTRSEIRATTDIPQPTLGRILDAGIKRNWATTEGQTYRLLPFSKVRAKKVCDRLTIVESMQNLDVQGRKFRTPTPRISLRDEYSRLENLSSRVMIWRAVAPVVMATHNRFITRTILASREEPMTRLHWVAAGLAVTTGLVHLYLYWVQGFVPFLLASLGFLGIVAVLVVGVNRRLLYAGSVPFTTVQIAVWVVQGMPEFALGVADKTVQVALIVVLAYLFVTERRAKRARTTDTSTTPVAPVATGR